MSAQEDGRASGEPVFMKELDAGEEQTVRSLGIGRSYKRGTAIWHEGQFGDRVLIIDTGCVKLSRFTDEGREVVLGVRGPGDVIGELAAIEPRSRTASAITVADVTALVIPPADFASFLRKHPNVTLLMLRIIASRLADADSKRVEISAQDTLARVAARILELAARFGEEDDDKISIELPLSQEELAAWTGCSRDSVVKALSSMRALGWIETGRRHMTVLDRGALQRRAAVRRPPRPFRCNSARQTLKAEYAAFGVREYRWNRASYGPRLRACRTATYMPFSELRTRPSCPWTGRGGSPRGTRPLSTRSGGPARRRSAQTWRRS
jgi:CRP-like cAMP-binding protein